MKYFFDSIVKYWVLVVAIVFGISNATSIIQKQEALASKVDKLESIKDDVQEIKIRVERIDVKLEQLKERK